jgi:hypothetical protein
MPAGLAAPGPPANLGSEPRRADGQAIPRGHAPADQEDSPLTSAVRCKR